MVDKKTFPESYCRQVKSLTITYRSHFYTIIIFMFQKSLNKNSGCIWMNITIRRNFTPFRLLFNFFNLSTKKPENFLEESAAHSPLNHKLFNFTQRQQRQRESLTSREKNFCHQNVACFEVKTRERLLLKKWSPLRKK